MIRYKVRAIPKPKILYYKIINYPSSRNSNMFSITSRIVSLTVLEVVIEIIINIVLM